MAKVKYFKDLNHNYIIINTRLREGKLDYQHRMITRNHIKNLLSCKIKFLNEESHFYYEISSKQNIKNVFEKTEMDLKQLYRLFEGMRAAEKEMENFLLDSQCLLLCPEYIYAEPETEEYFFIYYPYYMEELNEKNVEGNMSVMSLPEFLVNKVKPDDKIAVAAVYKIYELIQDEKFIISEVMKIFESGMSDDVVYEKDDIHLSHNDENKYDYKYEHENSINNDLHEEEETINYESSNNLARKNTMAVLILSILCVMAAAAVFCVSYFYSLSLEEKIVSIAGIIVLVILSGFFLVYFLFNFTKQRDGGLKEKQTAHEEDNMKISNSIIQQPELQKSMVLDISQKAALKEDYGNTVFLEASIIKKENKLYGTNKGNKYHIDLTQLPCIIGKLAGSVDVVIKDKTISRIHAKLWKQEEEIYVSDMNSTNGTFKNGLRLEPNEIAAIEPGDELRFGEMTFRYR